jgi:hypothetical protein
MDGNDQQRPNCWDRIIAALVAAGGLISAAAGLVTALQGCSPS